MKCSVERYPINFPAFTLPTIIIHVQWCFIKHFFVCLFVLFSSKPNLGFSNMSIINITNTTHISSAISRRNAQTCNLTAINRYLHHHYQNIKKPICPRHNLPFKWAGGEQHYGHTTCAFHRSEVMGSLENDHLYCLCFLSAPKKMKQRLISAPAIKYKTR